MTTLLKNMWNFKSRYCIHCGNSDYNWTTFSSPRDISAGNSEAAITLRFLMWRCHLARWMSALCFSEVWLQHRYAVRECDDQVLIKLSTDIGTMFGNLQAPMFALFREWTEGFATATITGTEIKFTLDPDFPTDRNFMSGSHIHGAELRALTAKFLQLAAKWRQNLLSLLKVLRLM